MRQPDGVFSLSFGFSIYGNKDDKYRSVTDRNQIFTLPHANLSLSFVTRLGMRRECAQLRCKAVLHVLINIKSNGMELFLHNYGYF